MHWPGLGDVLVPWRHSFSSDDSTILYQESNTRDDERGGGVQPVERRATCMLRM